MYGNEKEVGEAVRGSGLDRSDVFVTSKLNNGFHRPDDARRAFDTSLTDLGFDYVDLFLIHWPLPTLYDGDFVATWRTLEEFHREGRARSIGVSNFQVDHLQRLAAETDVVPAVNQIELHPYLLNEEVRAYGEAHGIATEAWSPIAQGQVLDDPVITAIAGRIGRSPAQVVLRWHIQRGSIVFPKSTTPARIKENFELFDFELEPGDVEQIETLDRGEEGRTGPNPDAFAYVPA
jgi:2,5-diketo-D-gluconate reductase A